MWATSDVAKLAVSHQVHETCRSWARPSDHVPLVTEFAI
jgi:exodeoxyribonuclease-3